MKINQLIITCFLDSQMGINFFFFLQQGRDELEEKEQREEEEREREEKKKEVMRESNGKENCYTIIEDSNRELIAASLFNVTSIVKRSLHIMYRKFAGLRE